MQFREKIANQRGLIPANRDTLAHGGQTDHAASVAAGSAIATPLVSVIVLNFNGEPITGRCLDHLLAQTYAQTEIIVVDNGSTDRSLEILQAYETRGNVCVIRGATNRGVSGGRNLGLLHAKGDVVAFIDNDAYASRTWLAEAVGTLHSDPSIGAVASLVFFDKHKIILNGAGGTLNYQGYGGDLCFNAPFEFADLPDDVLYPMGCGMVIRRAVMDAIGTLDEILTNYYDDVEVGIRIWQRGHRVVLSPAAWIDHEGGYSNRFSEDKTLLCERGRIRNALKYFPRRQLVEWLLHELTRVSQKTLFSAWGWNLLRLRSALRWRRRHAAAEQRFWPLTHPSWGTFPPPGPPNHSYRPHAEATGNRLLPDGRSDAAALNFGWYNAESDGAHTYRWTAARASAYFNFRAPVHRCSITCHVPHRASEVDFMVRPLGELSAVYQNTLRAPAAWEVRSFDCQVSPGLYELILYTHPVYHDGNRELGVGVERIEFA